MKQFNLEEYKKNPNLDILKGFNFNGACKYGRMGIRPD